MSKYSLRLLHAAVMTYLWCAARAEALFADLGHFSKGTIRVCQRPLSTNIDWTFVLQQKGRNMCVHLSVVSLHLHSFLCLAVCMLHAMCHPYVVSATTVKITWGKSNL